MAWWKLITNEGLGEYTVRRQRWKSSTGAFVDVPDRPDVAAEEVHNYHQIPLGATAVDAMPKFFACEEHNWEGDTNLVLFDWFAIQPTFWAIITGNAVDAAGTNRWKYAWSEVVKAAAGYAGFAALTNGRSGTTSTDPLRNSTEYMNTGAASHVEGNGVDTDNLDTSDYTLAIMPCTTDNIVQVKIVPTTAGFEYWIPGYENGVDGECD
jgi:hypothetical protein